MKSRFFLKALNFTIVCLISLGITLITIVIAIMLFLSNYDIEQAVIFDRIYTATLKIYATPQPYFIASLVVIIWYGKDIIFKSEEFKLNRHLTVRFENRKTVIFVNNKPFRICKYLLMNIPRNEIHDCDSIDEASEFYNKQLDGELKPKQVGLTPKEEFKAHCSNLQVWVEYDYDTRLLHRNLAFPLLLKLSIVGDTLAKQVLSQEVLDRFRSRSSTVQRFLVEEGYLNFLENCQVEELCENIVDKNVLYYLVGYYERIKNRISAIKVVHKLIEIDPINYKGHFALAYLYLKIEEIPMAILVVRKLLMLYPNDGKSLFILAHLYMFQGKIERTKQILKRQKIRNFQNVRYKNIKQLEKYMYPLFGYDPFPYNSIDE